MLLHSMMRPSSLTLFFFTLFIFFFSATYAHTKEQENSTPQGKDGNTFSAIYAFGESYTDTGNAYMMGHLTANYAAMSHHSGGRLDNGRLVVDYLSAALSVPPPQPYRNASITADFKSGVNFAVAGSTSLSTNYFTNQEVVTPVIWRGKPTSFKTQVDWFKKFLGKKECVGKHAVRCKEEFKDALFWVGAMGISDYFRIQGTSVSQQWLTQLSIPEVSNLIKTLINSGAKYIVVEGLPPLGCLPIGLSLSPTRAQDQMGCAATINSAIMRHNQILKNKLQALRRKNRQCTIVYADFWNAYVTVMTNPSKYHFTEPKKACCGSGGDLNFNLNSLCGAPGIAKCKEPAKYMSWDGIHLTEAMNQLVADLYINQNFCEPSFNKMIKSMST